MKGLNVKVFMVCEAKKKLATSCLEIILKYLIMRGTLEVITGLLRLYDNVKCMLDSKNR